MSMTETIRLIMAGDTCIVCGLKADGHICFNCRLDYYNEKGEQPEVTAARARCPVADVVPNRRLRQ